MVSARTYGPVRPMRTIDDALRLLRAVKGSFLEQPHKYTEFLHIMFDFKAERLSKEEVVERVEVLFDGYPTLILAFNAFLPPGYEIKLGGK